MIDLENHSPTPENDDGQKPVSPGIMLTTMLLLITGLLLSSILMLYHAMERKDGKSPDLNLGTLLEHAKTQAAKPQKAVHPAKPQKTVQPAADREPKQKQPAIKEILSGGSEKKVKWPKLKLSGFGSSADGGFAIINNQEVFLGQNIGKVKLVEVRHHGIVVEYMGERKTLSVDIKN